MITPKTPIHTIQFLDLPCANREVFLTYKQQYITYFVTQQHKDTFEKEGINVNLFHNSSNEKLPVLIHCLIVNNVFTVRAYTQDRIKELKFWLQLFQQTFPDKCENIIESTESFEFKLNPTKTYCYNSKNWIPFSRCGIKDGYYIDLQKPKSNAKNQLKERLYGNLDRFLKDMNFNLQDFKSHFKSNEDFFVLKKLPIKNTECIALKKNNGTKVIAITKKAFEVSFYTNFELPFYFSVGQNASYGNGVFMRDNSKTIYHETPKVNTKPTKME